jgi:hypothetical protein
MIAMFLSPFSIRADEAPQDTSDQFQRLVGRKSKIHVISLSGAAEFLRVPLTGECAGGSPDLNCQAALVPL